MHSFIAALKIHCSSTITALLKKLGGYQLTERGYINAKVNWATSRENLSSEIFDQVRFKPACSATEASKSLETLDIASIHILLSEQRTTKVLISLRGCAGWSAPLLFAYGIRHVFAWPGPIREVLLRNVAWVQASVFYLFIYFFTFLIIIIVAHKSNIYLMSGCL